MVQVQPEILYREQVQTCLVVRGVDQACYRLNKVVVLRLYSSERIGRLWAHLRYGRPAVSGECWLYIQKNKHQDVNSECLGPPIRQERSRFSSGAF